jgi:hypothetical protein
LVSENCPQHTVILQHIAGDFKSEYNLKVVNSSSGLTPQFLFQKSIIYTAFQPPSPGAKFRDFFLAFYWWLGGEDFLQYQDRMSSSFPGFPTNKTKSTNFGICRKLSPDSCRKCLQKNVVTHIPHSNIFLAALSKNSCAFN